MNYKYKLYIQKIISLLPQEDKINYLFQRFISKSIPIPDDLFISKLNAAISHYSSFIKYKNNGLALSECRYYEFGAGWDLTFPLVMSVLGFNEINCIDIKELTQPSILNSSINRLVYLNKTGIDYCPHNLISLSKNDYKQKLKENYRINYIAPRDAAYTGFPGNSIDLIVSHATLEHIPRKAIKAIIAECCRITKPGGIISFEIDYTDHFSYFDNNISAYNFLQFSPKEFEFYNTKLLYQNRMRHKDYLKILAETDLELLEVITGGGSEEDIDKLNKLKLDNYFRKNYSIAELAVKKARMVLRKNR
jgi:Methylase involved in ubiquinone/menaquinone biosynthesis